MRQLMRQLILTALFSFLLLALLSCGLNTALPPSLSFLDKDYGLTVSRVMDEEDYSNRFVIIRDLLKQILSREGIDTLRSFVHQYSILTPEDPFNGYYHLLVAEHYRDRNTEMSIYYYNQALNFYNDVIIEDVSTHYAALENLLFRMTDPTHRIAYYNRLLADFPQVIDSGLTWYQLAQEYRRNGQFQEYFQALEEFQQYPETIIQSRSDIHQAVARELDFHYNSRKDWTNASLSKLVSNIKNALLLKQPATLDRHRAKETFFAMSWLQDATDFNSQLRFDIGLFLLRAPRITYDEDFTIVNDTEAFLKTSGWSYRIPHWYFYFRKVDYPADPEIHGNWEWAGIFFGDTL